MASPLLLLLAACGVLPADQARPLRVGLLGAPSGLDPHLQNDFVTHSVLFNLFEGLTAFDPKMELRPALAERWESPDDLTWRFLLRRGALFHDGREVSAADVAFSLERARRARESGAADYLTAIRAVRQLDHRTVELTTVRPYALLPHKLTAVAIVPANSPERIEQPIGSGPYELVSASSSGLRLRAFPRYWRGVATVREVELEVVPSPEERLARVRAGTLDLALNLQPAQALTLIGAAAGPRLVRAPGLTVTCLAMRVDRGPFQDPRVRAALAGALDRERLAAALYLGQADPAGQLVVREVFGYHPQLSPPAPNPEQARALVAAAGHRSGLAVTLEARAGAPTAELERQLGAAGFAVTVRPHPWSELVALLAAGEFELYLGGYQCPSGDASDLLDGVLHTSEPERGYGIGNSFGYSEPELDSLVERASGVLDMAQRRRLLEKAMELAVADSALVPLCAPYQLAAAAQGIQWSPRLDSFFFADEVKWSQ